MSRQQIDPRVEIFYDPGTGSQWNDHTNRVRGGKTSGYGIDINRGASSESATADPSTCEFTINNRDGLFSPRNPRSPLFGKIGRNTPVRVRLGEPHLGATNFNLTDTTAHVAPSIISPTASAMLLAFWAAPQTGSYTLPGSMTFEGSTSSPVMSLAAGSEQITATGATGTRTATFSATEDYVAASVLLRGDSPAVVDQAVLVQDSGIVQSATVNVSAGDWVVFASYMGWDDHNQLLPSYPVANQGGWILLADTGTLQPDDAQATFFRMMTWAMKVKVAGEVKVRPTAGVVTLDATGSLIVVSNVEDFLFRFHGEASEWPHRWDQYGNDVWLPMETAGITRRISRTEQSLRDTVNRYVDLHAEPATTSFYDRGLIGYWPVRDEEGSQRANSLVRGQLDMKSNRGNRPEYGRSELDVHLPNGARTSLDLSGDLEVTIQGGQQGTPFSGLGGWAAEMLYRTDDPADWGDDLPQGFHFEIETNDVGEGIFSYLWETAVNVTGGTLRLRIENLQTSVDVVNTSVPIGDMLNGFMHHLRMQASHVSGTTSNFSLYVDGILRHSVNAVLSPPFTPDPSLLRVNWIIPSEAQDIPIRFGQIVLWGTSSPPIAEAAAAAFGHRQETPGERLERICAEEDIDFSLIDISEGISKQSEIRMGPQYDEKLIDVLDETAETGNGILFEPREFGGLAYRTVASMYNQVVVLPLDYEGCELNHPLQPTDDDRAIANDVTASRRDGGQSRARQISGPLNVNDPYDDPEGVGIYDTSDTVNVHSDPSTWNQAGWRLSLGTIDKEWYTSIRTRNLTPPDCPTDPDVSEQGAALDIGDRLTIDNMPDWMAPDLVETLLRGYEEHLDWYEWGFECDTMPEEKFHIGVIGQDRYSPLDSTTTADFDSGADTALTVQDNTNNNDLWSTTTTFPFDIKVAGVVLRVTGIAGASNPQTMTVQVAPINGIVKTIPAGSRVELARPVYRGI